MPTLLVHRIGSASKGKQVRKEPGGNNQRVGVQTPRSSSPGAGVLPLLLSHSKGHGARLPNNKLRGGETPPMRSSNQQDGVVPLLLSHSNRQAGARSNSSRSRAAGIQMPRSSSPGAGVVPLLLSHSNRQAGGMHQDNQHSRD